MANGSKKESSSRSWGFWVGGFLIAFFMLFFFGMILLVFMAPFIASEAAYTTSGSGNVALIKVHGIILTERAQTMFAGSAVGSSDLVKLIEKANEDDNIDAIVLEINSPGGSAVASDEIGQALKKVNKTTVSWIREVGASGGYWIASNTDHIVANRMSITGSIGVISGYIEFADLLTRFNMTYRGFTSGEYKDLGSPYKHLTEEEAKILQQHVDKVHDFFVDEVASNRGMDREEVAKLATGLFYLGADAYEHGLIDELGGKDELKAYLTEQLGEEPKFVEFKTRHTFFDSLVGSEAKQQPFSPLSGLFFIDENPVSIRT